MTRDEAIESWERVSADESWVNPHAHIENLIAAGDRLLAALASPAPQPAERNICAHCGEWNDWDEPAAAPAPQPDELRIRSLKCDAAGRWALTPAPVEPPPAKGKE
jgi:hypothetical protein